MVIELSGSDDHTEAELVFNTITFPQNGGKFLYFFGLGLWKYRRLAEWQNGSWNYV